MIKNVLLLIFGCKVSMIFFNLQIYFPPNELKISILYINSSVGNFCPYYGTDALIT